jgi:cytolysin-activating lysine-acyltransferase
MNRFNLLSFKPSTSAEEEAKTLGFILAIMSKCRTGVDYSISHFNKIIRPAITHGKIRIYFSTRGEPVAYYVWAHLAPDVEADLLAGKPINLHISEWNEGENVWILDLAAPLGHFGELKKQIEISFSSEKFLRYGRKCRNRFICREVEN